MRKPVFLLGLILITALLWPTRANTEELKKYIPLQDTNGSVLALADENGNLIERVSYTPYGKPTFIYDHVPPNIDQVRIVGDALRIRFSEPVDQTKALEAITLTQGTTALTGNASFSEDDRLLSIKSSNGFPQQALTLEIATTLEDKYENHLVNSFTQDFTPTGVNQLIYDCCPPNIKSVLLVDGAIRVEFDEEIDPASIANSLELTDRDLHTPVAGVISLYDEKTATLTPSSPLTLFDSNSQTPTSYVLRIKTTFTDLSNKPLDGEMLQYFAYHGNNRIIYKAPAEDEHTRSSVGNTITFQGHEYDPDTGLIHFRNRDYSPELGRFLQPDPMGYADSSNLYQAFGNNPVNMTDPLGLEAGLTRTGWIVASNVKTGKVTRYSPDYIRNHGVEIRQMLGTAAGLNPYEADALMLQAGRGDVGKQSLFADLSKRVDVDVRRFAKDAAITEAEVAVAGMTFGTGTAIMGTGWAGVTISGGLSGVMGGRTSNALYGRGSSLKSDVMNFGLGAGTAGLFKLGGAFDPWTSDFTLASPPTSVEPTLLGKVTPPANANPGTTTFGNRMHEQIAEMLRAKFPGVKFKFNIKPGQTGVDIVVPPQSEGITGFRYADIKPRTPAQAAKFAQQVENWGFKPGEVKAITYDANGNVYEGF